MRQDALGNEEFNRSNCPNSFRDDDVSINVITVQLTKPFHSGSLTTTTVVKEPLSCERREDDFIRWKGQKVISAPDKSKRKLQRHADQI